LNCNPTLSKTTISIPVPKITKESREKTAKTVRAMTENALKKMRDVESTALRKAKDNKKVSEDDVFNASEHVTKITTMLTS
jgi:ribosome recycling factor